MQELNVPETSRAHSIRCLESAQRLDALRETIPRRIWRAEVEAAWDDCRTALQWALAKQGNILLGQRLVGALETAWWVLPDTEAQLWVRAAIEAGDEMTPRNVRGRLNLALARLRIQHHRFKACHLAAQRALLQARAIGDQVGIARAEFLTGHSLVVLGSLSEGERLLESALVNFRKLGARRSVGRTLASLALAREHSGDLVTACSLCAEAVDTIKSVEGEDGEVDYLSYLAELEFHAGNTEEALALVSQALERHRMHNDRLHVAVDLNNAAAYSLALDRYDEAVERAREAVGIAVEDGNALWTAFAMQHMAAIGALRGDGTHAARLLGYVDTRIAQFQHQREYTEEQEYERVMATLRSEVGESELARLMAEGGAWTEERAVAEALEV